MKRYRRSAVPQHRHSFEELRTKALTMNVARELRNRWNDKTTAPAEVEAREFLEFYYKK